MHWFTKHLRNVGIASVSILFLLTCLTLVPLSAASAHEGISGAATPTTVTGQATLTEDATVTALNKEKLAQEVQQLKEQNEPDFFGWLRTNSALLLSTLVVVIGGLIGLFRWFGDRQNEREKQAEGRFQSAVVGLGDDKEGARVGAAILLRTFLRPGYEQFYAQTFDLAVAHLRLPRRATSPEDPDTSLPLTTLSQALIVVFKEAFPLARRENPDNPQSLDATSVQLDSAYLVRADLKQAWMRRASLRNADLFKADLSGARLFQANLSGAWLVKAILSGTDLCEANFRRAKLVEADLREANLKASDLSGADLSKADLSGADLRGANLIRASLNGSSLSGADLRGAKLDMIHITGTNLSRADLRQVSGLTREQLARCQAKGAIIDEDATSNPSQSTVAPPSLLQSNDTQAPSTPLALESISIPDPDGSDSAST